MTWNDLKKHVDAQLAAQNSNGDVDINLIYIMEGLADAGTINVKVTDGAVEIEE
jgi:hypothetical protein